MTETQGLQRISVRKFVRGEYQLGQPFLVQHRGADLAMWLPLEEISAVLLQRILQELPVRDTGPG